MPYNQTRDERNDLANRDLALKVRLETTLAERMRVILNTVADDYQALFTTTGEILNADVYNDQVSAALAITFTDAANSVGGRYYDFVEENQTDNAYLALLLLAFLDNITPTQKLDDLRAGLTVVINEWTRTTIASDTAFIAATTNRELLRHIETVETEIVQGLAPPLTQRETAREAASRFRGGIVGRAKMIGRTEAQGAVEGIKQLDTDYIIDSIAPLQIIGWATPIHIKEWLTRGDEAVRRPTLTQPWNHVAADGQQRVSDEFFSVSGENLMYPRDPRGAPGNIINCRCASIIAIDIDINQLGQEQLERLAA